MASRSERRSLSRDLLREVNERVAEIGSRENTNMLFLCECAGDYCVEHVRLSPSRYEEIRESGGYVLAAGHQVPLD